jgi:outer membrane receptor protein involved in Fe transport
MTRYRRILLAASVFILLSAVVSAQTTGKISGTVTDAADGSPLIGANVMIDGTSLGAATDAEGTFFIINVPPGTFSVTIRMMGYESMKYENVTVNVNRTSEIKARMKQTVVEGQVVVVQADKMTTKKDQTGSIRNVSAAEIELLPVESSGAIVNMQAGVVQGHFRGGRSGEVSYLIDGIQVDNALNRGRAVDVDVDAIQDLEVITGTFNAEYGRAMSGVVNMITKDGSNRFHGNGTAYWGNYYASHKVVIDGKERDVFPGLSLSDFNRNQDYQASIEGPIINDHLFFMVNARYQKNLNHLVGIRKFNMTDLSDYQNYPDPMLYFTQATGDSAEVPMNNNEIYNITGKLTWKMKSKKLSAMYVLNDAEYHDYDRTYYFAPDGRGISYPRSHMGILQWNHMFSGRAFYEAKVSYLHNYNGYYLYEDPTDPGYVHDKFLANSGETGFYTGGQYKGHYVGITERLDGKLDFTWQVNRHHALKIGGLYTAHRFDSQYYNIMNKYRNTDFETDYYIPEILPDSTIYADCYFKEPVEIAAYIQDKIEYDEMVINFGIRYEYFDPATSYATQLRNPGNLLAFPDNPEKMSTYPDADVKVSVSPRFGLSYQLAQSALLRFSYGHFTQFPAFSTMYQNDNYILGTTSYQTTVGFPQVKPEKTVNYEVGYWQRINAYMDVEVALFYKDIYDLSTVVAYQTYNNVWYGVYGNKDYGNVRGLELKYNLMWNKLYVGANYTLQYTRGNADDPLLSFNRAGNSQSPIAKLIPLGWDQRHTLNVTVGMMARTYSVSATAYYGSGGVYTWSAIPENRLYRVNLYPNNSYKPTTLTVDLRAQMDLVEIRGIKLRAVLQGYNMLDRMNEYGVNGNTGRANQSIIRPEQILAHKSDFVSYNERIYNPAAYSTPRFIKAGLEFRF